MTTKNNSILFIVITTMYLSVVISLEENPLSSLDYDRLATLLPLLLSLTIASWIVRYLRWRYLLRLRSVEVPLVKGFFIYLTGFAYTITPGKLGEMVRAKYLKNDKGKEVVFSAFFFERMFDLLTVLLLSIIAFSYSEYTLIAASFVLIVLVLLCLVEPIANNLFRSQRMLFINRVRCIILKITSNIKTWITFKVVTVSSVMGMIAWLLMGLVLRVITVGFDLTLPILDSLGIYPLSMLIGAASMIPGGVGSTEAAIVTLLSIYNVDLDIAIGVAIIARVITLWLAVLAGFISVWFMEYDNR